MPVTNSSPNVDNYIVGRGKGFWKDAAATAFRDFGNLTEFAVTVEAERLSHYSRRSGIRQRDRSVVVEQRVMLSFTFEEWTAENLAIVLMGTASSAAVSLSTTASTTSGSPTITTLASTANLVKGRRYQISGAGIPSGTTVVFDGATGGTMDKNATATGALVAVTITGAISLDIASAADVKGAFRFQGTNAVGAPCTYEFNDVSLTPDGALSIITDEWGSATLTGECSTDDFDKFGQLYWNVASGNTV